MAKTIFEEMGGTYTQVGDYLLPDLKLPEEEQQPIGVWGQRHRRYLKEHRRATYATLFTGGKLNSYLADIDRQAEEMFSRLVKQMAEAEGVIEQLKADNQMEWVGRMNNIRYQCNRLYLSFQYSHCCLHRFEQPRNHRDYIQFLLL